MYFDPPLNEAERSAREAKRADLVDRLDNPYARGSDDTPEALCAEAADGILRLRAALNEAADELDAYYAAEYAGDHPYSVKKLAEAKASNPARAALMKTP